ncbi:MAG TPA: hypothetical protein VIH26_06370 [Anaerolineales bacterium]
MVLQLSLWTGIVGLYLAIAGALGAILRQLFGRGRPGWDRILAAAYTFLLFSAASAFVLAITEWPDWSRLAVLGAGIIAAWVAAARPIWIPAPLWRPTFGHRYLAGVMALAALWGINQAMTGSPTAPLMIAVSALAAGAASSGTSLRIPSFERSESG